MRASSQRSARPPTPWVADPALVALVIITAMTALATQPFWSLGVSDPSAVGEPPVLHVAANRTVTIDGDPVSGSLVDHVAHVLDGRHATQVLLEADDDASYGDVSRVIRQIRLAGGEPRPR